MAETAKFRREEMPTGWDAAKQSFRQSPAAGAVTAVANTARNLLSVPGAIMQAGEAAGRNFDMAQGSGGGFMPPAAMAEAERVRQELNPNGAGVLINALPNMVSAAEAAPMNFRAAVTNQPTYPEARSYTPDMSLTPRTTTVDTSFAPAPTAGNVEATRAENYGRGITEILNVPGQQGRSFTNLIPAGAPATGINEMTQRFRSDPQGAVSDGGAVMAGVSGRGSFRTAAAPEVAPAGVALTGEEAALARQRELDWQADNRATNARDVAAFNTTKDMPFWERNNMSNKMRLGVAEIGEQAARTALSGQTPRAPLDVFAEEKVRQTGEVAAAQAGKFRAEAESEPVKAAAAQAKAVADAKEATSKFGVNLEASFEETPLDPANPLLGTTKTISGFTSKGGANPVFIPLAAMQAYRAARSAATTPEELQAVEAKFRNYYQL